MAEEGYGIRFGVLRPEWAEILPDVRVTPSQCYYELSRMLENSLDALEWGRVVVDYDERRGQAIIEVIASGERYKGLPKKVQALVEEFFAK